MPAVPLPVSELTHKFQPGNPTWGLEPAWKGSYPMVLSTPAAVGITYVTPLTHHIQLKEATEDKDRRPSACRPCLPVEKAHKPQEPRPWVYKLKMT